MKDRIGELEILLNSYVELNKLNAEPGEKCHMIAMSIHFIERQISKLLKRMEEYEV